MMAQRELNRHAAVVIKIFKKGKNWGPGTRVRETMMSESTEACPFHLLYTDQRGWSVDKGGELPTRHVAGGNRGMNLLIIEVILDILRPMVTMVKGGKEVISTEDSLARFEDMNITMV